MTDWNRHREEPMPNGHRHRFWTDDTDPHGYHPSAPFQEERRRALDKRPIKHPILRAIGFLFGIAGVLVCVWLLIALLSIIVDG